MNENRVSRRAWLPHALSLSAAVVVYVVLTHFSTLWVGIKSFLGFFSPVFLAAVIAYLVNPLANFFRRTLFKKTKKEKARAVCSNALAFLTVLALLTLLLVILIPQLIEGATAFVANLDIYMEKAKSSLPDLKFFGKALNLQSFLESRDKLMSALADMLKNNADTVLQASAQAGKSLFLWVIALFLSIYFLSEKDRLRVGAKRLLQALLPQQHYETAVRILHRCDSILNRYVVYNLLDSLIIGGANAIFMAVMGIPYIGLVSFIVAVTNLIPTFGPMIGAAIGALILSLVGLPFTVAFLIFTAVLQLCDAYLVKPKLFGSSLGVSSLWILIGIIVGGRMFGAIGVLLAIPAVAILDFLYTDYILPRLEAREQKPIM